MSELLKDHISKEFVLALSSDLKLDQTDFIKEIESSRSKLELKDRTKLISSSFNKFIKSNYPGKIEALSKIVQDYSGLQAMVFTEFIEMHGMDHYKTSIQAIELFTQFGTAEFAIRPFIEKYPETMEQMLEWSKHENLHIRRLACEGCRPKLPWASPLRSFIKDPSPILPILENLKDAPEDYVYRSVANNLNDISKDHPELTISLANSWRNSSDSANWAIKHGMRTLLKQGHPECFNLFNYGALEAIETIDFNLDANKCNIGESATLNLNISLNQTEKRKYRIDYKLHFVKSNGKTNGKVFSYRENSLNQGKNSFTKKINFKNLSTRKYYPGLHKIELIINGKKYAETEINVQED